MTDTSVETGGRNGARSRPPSVSVTEGGAAGPEAKTPLGTAPIIPLLMAGTGLYLLWFMTKYWRQTGANVWPSAPIKSILQGKGIQLTAASKAPPTGTTVSAYEASLGAQIAAQEGAGTSTSSTSPGTSPPGGPPPTGSAQNMAKLLLTRYGWGPSEMGPLILLWNRESGWRSCAYNVSGAYGVAQALGHGGGACATGPRCVGSSSPGLNCAYGGYGQSAADSKLANAGNVLKQIEWGLGYIKATYGSPTAAWSHEQRFGWY